MLIDYHLGATSIILRVKLRSTASASGGGLTGLTNASAGLTIAAIADNEATTTPYVAGTSIDTITTLGVYAAPTATHCRFKEVDPTYHKGVYEIQLENSRYAVSNAKSLIVSFSGAANLAECDVCIPLRTVDPYNANFGLTGLAGLAAPAAAGGLPTLGTGAGQVHVDGSGGVQVGAYSTNQDPGTLIFAFATETGGETFLKTLRMMRAVLAGVATDSAGTATFKRADGTTTSLTVVHDASGNRSTSTPGTN